MGDGFQYNPDEIEDILKKYSGDTTSQQNTGSSKPDSSKKESLNINPIKKDSDRVEPLFTTRNVETDRGFFL